MAITARVVELMGGTISVESEVGKGSEFVVELELESLEPEDGDSDSRDAGIDLTGRKVLVVEDNDINAEIAIMILDEFGIDAEWAENGKVGVDLITEHGDGHFDAVLMDIQMPVMDGYEATRAIRALGGDYCTNLPIIAVSANAYDQDVQDCLAAGMNAHVAKPYNPEDLQAVLSEWIGR